jgi:homopolymeric O-antigen transport system permease protein
LRLRAVLRDFWQSFRSWEVWLHLGQRDVLNRYKGSLVGPLWIMISNGVMVLGLTALFGRIFSQQVNRFVIFLSVGTLLWGLLASSITDGGYAFIAAESYIKQIPFPKQVYLLRTWVVCLFVFSFGAPVVIVAASYYRLPIAWGSLWAVPGMLLLLVCCLGHITLMAYLAVFFRDLPHAAQSLLQMLYFFTPIIYPVELLRQRGLTVLLYNPFYCLIEAVRYPLLEQATPPDHVYLGGISYAVVLWAVALGVAASRDRYVAYSL